jgi:hypothetical protein
MASHSFNTALLLCPRKYELELEPLPPPPDEDISEPELMFGWLLLEGLSSEEQEKMKAKASTKAAENASLENLFLIRYLHFVCEIENSENS